MRHRKQVQIYLPSVMEEKLKVEAEQNGLKLEPYMTMLLAQYVINKRMKI